jgi:hypothetical protein
VPCLYNQGETSFWGKNNQCLCVAKIVSNHQSFVPKSSNLETELSPLRVKSAIGPPLYILHTMALFI